jgi:CheY-like chemotaxis protein
MRDVMLGCGKPFDKSEVRLEEWCRMGASAACGGILVVDDDPDIRDSLREVLEDEGYEVACVGNGQEALDHLKTATPRPCVILLDLMMPVMDGWQFRREQKLHAEIADIPLVVITATGKRPVLIDAAELVMKPLDLTQLFAAIERYCQ